MDSQELNRLRHARIAQCIQEMNALCDEVASLREDIAQSDVRDHSAPDTSAQSQPKPQSQPAKTTLYGVPSAADDLKRQA